MFIISMCLATVIILHAAAVNSLCPGTCRCTNFKTQCWSSNLQSLPLNLMNTTERLFIELDNITMINSNMTSLMGIHNLKQLMLEFVHLDTIEVSAFQSLRSLEHLTIRGNPIPTLERFTFRGLPFLHYLDLSYNNISSIQAGVFEGLTSLRHLDLHGNKLTRLLNDTFDGLRKKHCVHIYTQSALNLRQNRIQHIDSGAFRDLCMFTEVKLDFNKITEFEPDTFSGLTRLNVLSAKSASYRSKGIRHLKAGTFGGSEGLRQLNIASNKIHELGDEQLTPFQNMLNLITLDLSNNDIQILRPFIFQELKSLIYLSLLGNNIFSFHSNVFAGLVSVRTLKFTVKTIYPNTFKGLPNLQIINIGGGELILHKNAFSGLTGLKELTLKHENIIFETNDSYSSPFSLLPSLKKFVVNKYPNYNSSSNVFPNFSRLDDLEIGNSLVSLTLNGIQVLKILYLHINLQNGLSSSFSLNSTLRDLYYVAEFELKVSGIESHSQIPNFHSIPVSFLDLSTNRLSVIQNNTFQSLTLLKGLSLRDCTIKKIEPLAFEGLDTLSILDLSSNCNMSLYSGMFKHLHTLQQLSLCFNLIPNFNMNHKNPLVFLGLSNLQELTIATEWVNSLAIPFSGMFSGLSDLKTLYLDFNNITVLRPGAFAGLHRLTKLNLVVNQIYDLPAGVFKGLTSIKFIDLDRNRISSLNPGVFGAVCDENFTLSCANTTRLSHYCDTSSVLTSLEYLALSANNISYIHPHTFLGCNKLSSLDLNDNRMFVLETGFLYTPALQFFRMNNCSITQIPETFFQCTRELIDISIWHNNISTFHLNSLQSLSRLKYFFAHYTVCDCSIKSAWKWLHQYNLDGGLRCGNLSGSDTINKVLSTLQCNETSLSEESREFVHVADSWAYFRLYIEPVIFFIIFISGIIGNGFLLYVCLRFSEMRTINNACVMNLAIADLLSLIINLALSYWEVLNVVWELGINACRTFLFLKDLSVAVSVFSVLTLSIQRFSVILNSISLKCGCGFSDTKTTTLFISMAWVFAIGSALPVLFSAYVDGRCFYGIPGNVNYIRRIWTSQFLAYCLIPGILVIILNGIIAYTLRKSVRDIPGVVKKNVKTKGRQKVANMVLILATMFAISYFPSFTIRVLVAWSLIDVNSVFIGAFITFCLFFCNSVLNPISLFIMSSQFKSVLLRYFSVGTKNTEKLTPRAPVVSERDIELQEIQKARKERILKIQARFK